MGAFLGVDYGYGLTSRILEGRSKKGWEECTRTYDTVPEYRDLNDVDSHTQTPLTHDFISTLSYLQATDNCNLLAARHELFALGHFRSSDFRCPVFLATTRSQPRELPCEPLEEPRVSIHPSIQPPRVALSSQERRP